MKMLSIPCWFLWVLVIAIIVSLSVIIYDRIPVETSLEGFVLPPGDSELGQAAFVELGCVSCHTVNGVVFDSPLALNRQISFPLGGEVTRVKTYGELVTSIIHPSDSIDEKVLEELQVNGKSPMPEYQRQMTLEQLSNLVHFLRDHYRVKMYEYQNYNYQSPHYWNYQPIY